MNTTTIEHLARTLAAMPFSLAWSWAGYLYWTAGERLEKNQAHRVV